MGHPEPYLSNTPHVEGTSGKKEGMTSDLWIDFLPDRKKRKLTFIDHAPFCLTPLCFDLSINQ